MADRVSKHKRSIIMSKIRSTNTKPEVALRKALWARGARFRLHYGKERVDIAIPSKKIAIFVDGCFWHGCPIHSHTPKSNRAYWVPKLKKNILRANNKDKRLFAMGWKVTHIWEHELKDMPKVMKKEKKEKNPVRPSHLG